MMVSETMVTEADVICPATLQQVRDVQRPAVFGDAGAGAVAGESVPADISRMESVTPVILKPFGFFASFERRRQS